MIGSGRTSHRKRMPTAGSTQPWRAPRKCPFNFNSLRCTKACVSILATRSARGVAESSAQRGRGERRMPVAPAASCALVVVERTRVTTSTPESPDVPARNGFNGFLRALPGDRLFCHRHQQRLSCQLDASVEASGPHDFSVRLGAVRQKRRRVHRIRSQRS